MEKTKGRIIQIQENSQGNTMIVLTAQGEFLERPLPLQQNFQVGDEVVVPSSGIGLIPKLGHFTSVAAAASIVGFLLFGSIVTMATPAYYVHVDIDEASTPSIELAVSRNLRVVEATPLNPEGSKLLNDTNFRQETVQKAINSLVKNAEDLKYIQPEKDNTLLVSIAGHNNGKSNRKQEISKRIHTAAKKQLYASKSSATLGVATVDSSTRKQAQNSNASINSILKKKAKGATKLPKEYEVSHIIPGKNPEQASEQVRGKRVPGQAKRIFDNSKDWNKDKNNYAGKTDKTKTTKPNKSIQSQKFKKSPGSRNTNNNRGYQGQNYNRGLRNRGESDRGLNKRGESDRGLSNRGGSDRGTQDNSPSQGHRQK